MKIKKHFIFLSLILVVSVFFGLVTACDTQESTTSSQSEIVTTTPTVNSKDYSSATTNGSSNTSSTSNYGGLIDEGYYPN